MYNKINILVLTKFPLIALSLFTSFIVIGIIKYPGSTYLDNSTIGYYFFKNFLSDLGRTVTFNGVTNFYSSYFVSFITFYQSISNRKTFLKFPLLVQLLEYYPVFVL